MRSGEAKRLQWIDLDREKRIVTLNEPEKGSNPRMWKVSTTLIEMLNALRITDLGCLPALLHPAGVALVGTVPVTYDWSVNILRQAGLPASVRTAERLSALPAEP